MLRATIAVPALIIAGLMPVLSSAAPALILAEGGRAAYTIVTPAQPSPSVEYAAQELQRFLGEITGAQFAVRDDSGPLGAHEIILGLGNKHLAAAGVQVDAKPLGIEGYVLRTVGPHLAMVGGPQRGALYGVYGLLEDHLGCRWFTPEVSRIPKAPRLELPALDETRVPVLEYREPFVKDCFDGDWCARNRANSQAASLEKRHGGKVTYVGFVHTFNSLVPPEKYFDEHPEYFSLIDGQRRKGYYQLCLTNPDVVQITIREIRRLMRENPEAMVFSVSQNDTGYPCQCDKCQAIVKREGSEAGPLIEFVNQVADAVKDEFPDKAIDTLAYQYTRKAPLHVRPRPNVIVRLCSIECCFGHPLGTCDSGENAAFRKDMQDWAKVCDRLWIWDYTTSFANYMVPFPNLRVLDDNIRFFIQNHVTGIFEEDNYTSLAGELSPLGGYMMAKFLWDPNYDENRAMNEFLEGVYGPAAGPIRQYIDLLHDKVANENIHFHIWEGPRAPYLTDDAMAAADKLWDQAEAAVSGDAATLRRVREARMGHDWAALARTERAVTSPYRFAGDRYEADADPTFGQRLARFTEAARTSGLTALNEGGASPAEFIARTGQKSGKFELKTLAGRRVLARMAPALGGRLMWLSSGPEGPNVLSVGEPDDPGYPAFGGYSESWQASAGGPGSSTVFDYCTSDETDDSSSVEMAAEIAPGINLQRVVTVPRRHDYLEIVSTLTNQRGEARPGDLRGSFAFDLGDTDLVTAIVPGLGDGRLISLSLPADEASRRLSFTGAQVAQGITLLNHRLGRGVQIYPKAAEIERAWLTVDARRNTIGFEVKTRCALAPGASTELRQWVRVLSDSANLPQAVHTGATTHRALKVVAQEDQVGLGHYGEWCWIEADPKAEDGFAVHLNNNHIEWCVQWFYSPDQFEPGRTYEVFARVRVDKRGDSGPAFWAGIYDTLTGVGYGSIMPAMKDIPDSEYHLYRLGIVVPGRGHYVWIGPQNNMANAAGVYLDSFELRAVGE